MNNSSNLTKRSNVYDPFYRSQVTIIAQVTSLAVLGVIIMSGNLASIITFIKTQSLRRRSHYLIISLSVADLLVGVVDFMTMYLFLTGPQWNDFITVLEVIDTLTGIASVLTLSNISLERFYAVFFPFRHRLLRFRVYVVLCAFPWIAATYVALLYLISSVYDRSILKTYTYHTFIVATVALVILSISYITIGVKIRKNNPNAQDQNRQSRDQKLAVTLLIVTLCSLLTWLPLQCFIIVLYFCDSCPLPHFNVLFAMKFLQFLNSGINVFIYIVRMPEFRTSFLTTFCGKGGGNFRIQESTRTTAGFSIRNNNFVGDENQTGQTCRNRNNIHQKNSNSPYNNLQYSHQVNTIHKSNTKSNSYRTSHTHEDSRSSLEIETRPTQEDKKFRSYNTKRQVTQEITVTENGITTDKSSETRLFSKMDGITNYACLTEGSGTIDTSL